jgi:hypothetical protein
MIRCESGFGDCNDDPDDGCETPTTTVTDCGGCDNPCMRMNANVSCESGSCSITSCLPGFDDCDRLDFNGCETDVRSDSRNCGICDRRCTGPAMRCVDMVCVM